MAAKKKAKEKKEAQPEKDKATILKELTEELLKLMGISAQVGVEKDDENDALIVSMENTQEAGLLIGARGKTLDSLQSILGIIFKQKVGEWQRIVVNVADWRQKEEERLKRLAQQSAQRAKESGEPQYLYNLTPAQRRIVHLFLSEDKEVTTESQGEGSERFLIVSPKK